MQHPVLTAHVQLILEYNITPEWWRYKKYSPLIWLQSRRLPLVPQEEKRWGLGGGVAYSRLGTVFINFFALSKETGIFLQRDRFKNVQFQDRYSPVLAK